MVGGSLLIKEIKQTRFEFVLAFPRFSRRCIEISLVAILFVALVFENVGLPNVRDSSKKRSHVCPLAKQLGGQRPQRILRLVRVPAPV